MLLELKKRFWSKVKVFWNAGVVGLKMVELKKKVFYQNNYAWWNFAQKYRCSQIFRKTKFLKKCLNMIISFFLTKLCFFFFFFFKFVLDFLDNLKSENCFLNISKILWRGIFFMVGLFFLAKANCLEEVPSIRTCFVYVNLDLTWAFELSIQWFPLTNIL